MGNFKALLFVSISAIALATTARAADMLPPPSPMPHPTYEPAEFSGWYLRGDIGFSNQKVNKLTNPSPAPMMLSSSYGFDAAPTIAAPAVMSTMPNQWCACRRRRSTSTVKPPAKSTSVPRSIW